MLFFSSVLSAMSIDFLLLYFVTLFSQGATFMECFVTFRAGKWLLSSVDSFMFLQAAAMTECLVTFRTGKRLLSSMGSLMSLQVDFSDEYLVTFRAGKRLLSSTVFLLCVCSDVKIVSQTVFTHLTTKWILSCVGFFMQTSFETPCTHLTMI